MTRECSFDLDQLLLPIADSDGGAGTDPRLEPTGNSLYHQIAGARMLARQLEDKGGDPAGEGARALRSEDPDRHWRTIQDHAPGLIATSAKDLEVAAHLAEALLRRQGLAGLAEGLLLIAGLIERYWGHLFPRPAKDDAEAKEEGERYCLRQLVKIAGHRERAALVQPILKLPIAQGAPGPFAVWQIGRHLAEVQESARATPIAYYRGLIGYLVSCRTATETLGAALQAHCGEPLPRLDGLDAALTAVSQALGQIGDVRDDVQALLATPAEPDAGGTEMTATGPGGGETASGGPETAGAPRAASGTIASREDAFRLLERVAHYFRQTEPHSPLSYTLEEVVRRGRLPFPELLSELVPNDEVRVLALLRAGIKPKSDAS